MATHIQLRKTTNVDQFYNNHFFDTEEETLAFWKMITKVPHQEKWLSLEEKRVTVLLTVI